MKHGQAVAPAAHRHVALDGWRGLAALMVVLHHFPSSGHLTNSVLARNAWLFVDFFFVLSGFVIAANYGDRLARGFGAARFLLLRLGRLYPLHFVTLLAFVGVETLLWLHGGNATASGRELFSGSTSIAALASNLILAQSLGLHSGMTWNGVAWSVSTEFWTYAVFALLVIASPRRKLVSCFALALLACGFLVVKGDLGAWASRFTDLARCLYGFSLGALLHAAYVRSTWALSRALWTAGEIASIALAVGFTLNPPPAPAVHWFAPLCFAPAVLVFARDAGALSRCLALRSFATLGELSYGIYMIHPFLQGSVLMALGLALDRWTGTSLILLRDVAGVPTRTWGGDALTGDLCTVAMLAVTAVAARASFAWIENPGRRYAARLAERLAKRAR